MSAEFKLDKELQEYRDLMEVPAKFEEGFTFSSFLGAVFIALVMIPGAIYMQLVAGMGVGAAAQWVTVILFVEMAKRTNAVMKKAEIFILFYMAGAVMASGNLGLLNAQFLVRSEAAASFGIADKIPVWIAPQDVASLPRTFLHPAWIPALLMMVWSSFISKLDNTIVGYGLFRITSDIEKLPFPMAPMGAQGMLTLAEDFNDSNEKTGASWRWRAFSIGGGIGMVFGFLYMGVPALTGALLNSPVQIFPIPFVDWTPNTAGILPAVATGLCFDLGVLILGMVIPFYAAVGGFIGLLITLAANPLLYHFRLLYTWKPGQSTVETLFSNNVDFYLSFGIGLSLAIAIVGIVSVFRHRSKKPGETPAQRRQTEIPDGRGDIPNWLFLLTYCASFLVIFLLCGWLIDWHPGVLIVMVFFGVFYTPLISYVTARLEGVAGMSVNIPFVREAAFILSGYQGVTIWFLPIPMANYGMQTVFYKQAELTGTRFPSIWKVDVFLFPIILFATIGFSSFIFSLADVPSAAYPYTQEMWEFNAKNACLVYSSTLGYYSPFMEALNWIYIAAGTVLGLLSFGILSFFNAPTLLCYGVVAGFNQSMPHTIIAQFIGALLGQFYFKKKFGENWKRNIIVVSSGYFVGSGLISMLCVGIVFLSKSSSSLPY